MAGNVNDRFKQVATTSMLSSSSIQQNLTTSGTSMNQAYLNALSDVESTADEVDRTSDSSDTGMSSAEKTQMWVGLGTAVLAAVPGIMQGIAALKGGGQGGTGTGTGTGTDTGSVNPKNLAESLSAMADAYAAKTKHKKKETQALQDGIGMAQNQVEKNKQTISNNTTRIADLSEAADGKFEAIFKEFNDTIDKAQGNMATFVEAYGAAETNIKTYNEAISSAEDQINLKTTKKNENGVALHQVKVEKDGKEKEVNLIDLNIDEINAKFTDVNDQKAAHTIAYNDAMNAKPGIDQAVTSAKTALDGNKAKIGSLGDDVKDLKKDKGRVDKENTQLINSYDQQIRQKEDELEAEKAKTEGLKQKHEAAKAKQKHNDELIKDLEKALGDDDKSIVDLRQKHDTAQGDKETALAGIRDCETQIDKYVDIDKVLAQEVDGYEDKKATYEGESEKATIARAEILVKKDEQGKQIELCSENLLDVEACKKEAGAQKATLEQQNTELARENEALGAAIEKGMNALGLTNPEEATPGNNDQDVDFSSAESINQEQQKLDFANAVLDFIDKNGIKNTDLKPAGGGKYEYTKDGKTYVVEYKDGKFSEPKVKTETA